MWGDKYHPEMVKLSLPTVLSLAAPCSETWETWPDLNLATLGTQPFLRKMDKSKRNKLILTIIIVYDIDITDQIILSHIQIVNRYN